MTAIPRIPWNHDALMAAIAPVDEAFRQSELRWGVDRLPRMVCSATLESYRRGWVLWRKAIEHGDAAAAQQVGPKMIAALAFMDAEATAAGQTLLAVETWEARMEDGRVLVIVRTNAEASAIAQAANLGVDAILPPDLASAVRHQQEGRELLVYTLGELVRILPTFDLVNQIKRTWPGATVIGGPVTRENDTGDWVRQDPARTGTEGMSW